MIYTVTLNPSIDYVIYPEQDIAPGKVNRFETSHLFPGGKGINVSRILHELSIPSTASFMVYIIRFSRSKPISPWRNVSNCFSNTTVQKMQKMLVPICIPVLMRRKML